MKLVHASRGLEYMHRTWGRVLLIGCHPHDGACLIVERMAGIDPDEDDQEFATCEASDLEPAEGSEWPFLGFTSRERARAQSRAWGERHGFTENPEGSGRWFTAAGSPVTHEMWELALAKEAP